MTLQDAKGKRVYVVGNYRFNGKLLGKGNFARVEEATHTLLNVKVAIKIMDIKQIKEEYVIRNLCREAKLMARLNHPCICALYQTLQRSDNVYYLVTELAPGGDLCSFVKEQRGGRMEERPARIYARQFVSALAHMHQLGVVHRDLKMENVMLNSARTQIKIVDFGLSNFYSPEEPLKTHCGSPEYAAPELFVTGLNYGPEVDLWSLGIILYGMVVGQLPFVSNRNDQLSSQERRKRLVTQINKGLGNAHKRALSLFSPDFRNMVGRMLMADVRKRISIKELVTHPFITEKGTKSIRINPIKKLDVKQQAAIIAQICEVSHQRSEEIIRLIKEKPYSRIGGIYNILAHTYSISRLSGDGVTKIQPVLEAESIKAILSPVSPNKRPYNLRNISAKPTGSRGDIIFTSRITAQDRKISSQQRNRPPGTAPSSIRPASECKRPCTPTVGTRPKTVLPSLSEKKSNSRDARSPLINRKSSLAGITPKNNRPSTAMSPITNKVSSTMGTTSVKIAKDVCKRLCSSPPAAVDYNKPSTTQKGLPNGLTAIDTSGDKNEKCSVTTRAQTNLDRKQRSKSEKLTGVRPATTATPGGANRKSLATTQSDSKAANRPQTVADKEFRPLTRLLKYVRPSRQGMEKSAMGYGDIAQKNQEFHQRNRKPTIYDPIARSIAGYVSNNVPNKLPSLSHYKK